MHVVKRGELSSRPRDAPLLGGSRTVAGVEDGGHRPAQGTPGVGMRLIKPHPGALKVPRGT